MLDELAIQHGHLANSVQPQMWQQTGAEPPARQYIGATMLAISAMGIRQLRAAKRLIHAGFAPEARSQIRTSWEIAVDLGFLLQGAGRKGRAELWAAMSLLRQAAVLGREPAPGDDEAETLLKQQFGDQQPTRVDKFRSHPGLQADHWSGENKGDVRSRAFEYIASVLEGEDAEKLRQATQGLAFKGGSTSVHADPASFVWLPRARDPGKIEPSYEAAELTAILADAVGILMLAPIEAEVEIDSPRHKAPKAVAFDRRLAQILE